MMATGSALVPSVPAVSAATDYHQTRDKHHQRQTRNTYMELASAIDASTRNAYRETEYRVAHALPFVLRVGQTSSELAALYRKQGVRCAAYLTAANPLSQAASDEINAQTNGQLMADLRGRSLTVLEGVGQHPSGNWPGEPSFLVLGLDLEASKSLGRKYEQNAIVWCGEDAIARLVLLR
jgi:hypothetical protein